MPWSEYCAPVNQSSIWRAASGDRGNVGGATGDYGIATTLDPIENVTLPACPNITFAQFDYPFYGIHV